MIQRPYHRLLKWILLSGILISWGSCTKNLTSKYLVYSNDFEKSRLDNISIYTINGAIPDVKIEDFNGSKVLGRFNNNAVGVFLSSLPTHNAMQIEFDLNIHDKWDGITIGPTGKPDIWQMTADNVPLILTTFSNTTSLQSYPNFYGVSGTSPAQANAIEKMAEGICSLKGVAGGSSIYHIVKTVAHSGPNFGFVCNDALQPYNSLCLKSWSMDNLSVTAIKY